MWSSGRHYRKGQSTPSPLIASNGRSVLGVARNSLIAFEMQGCREAAAEPSQALYPEEPLTIGAFWLKGGWPGFVGGVVGTILVNMAADAQYCKYNAP